MLFERLDSDLNNFPKDLKKLIYNIDINKPLHEIFNDLFSFLEEAAKQAHILEPNGKRYCGFTLQDIKDPLYDCLLSSVYLYLEEKLLCKNDKKAQLELVFMDANEECNPDPSKRINRNKKKISGNIEKFDGKCDTDYYNCFTNILHLKNNSVIRSLELSHFLFAMPKLHECISRRFDIIQYSKLSNYITDYIGNPTSYAYGDIPVTPAKFLAVDFENAFHTSLFNQLFKYVSYVDEHQDDIKIPTSYFICIVNLISLLPPYWLKSSNSSDTIVDKICKYIMKNYNYAFYNLYMTVDTLLTMIHYPLEAAFSYLVSKKYHYMPTKKIINSFTMDMTKEGFKIYNDSIYLDQFYVDISKKDLNFEIKHYLLVNMLANFDNHIYFNYDEYNMFYVFGRTEIELFEFLKINRERAEEILKSDPTFNNTDYQNFKNNYLMQYCVLNSITETILWKILTSKELFIQYYMDYINNFPENAVFANRVKYPMQKKSRGKR